MLIKLNEDLMVDIKEIKCIFCHPGDTLYTIYFKGYKDAVSNIEITREDFDMINKLLIEQDKNHSGYFGNVGYNCL